MFWSPFLLQKSPVSCYLLYTHGLNFRNTFLYHTSAIFIIQNLNQHIELKEIAQALGFTPYYLSSVFKKETGKTINTYIAEQKIERAKYLLSSTTLSILDISNELAFSLPSYFSQQFRKIVGQTTQQFRKMPDAAL